MCNHVQDNRNVMPHTVCGCQVLGGYDSRYTACFHCDYLFCTRGGSRRPDPIWSGFGRELMGVLCSEVDITCSNVGVSCICETAVSDTPSAQMRNMRGSGWRLTIYSRRSRRRLLLGWIKHRSTGRILHTPHPHLGHLETRFVLLTDK